LTLASRRFRAIVNLLGTAETENKQAAERGYGGGVHRDSDFRGNELGSLAVAV